MNGNTLCCPISLGCGHFAHLEASGMKIGDKSHIVMPIQVSTMKINCLTFFVNMYALHPGDMGSLTVSFWQGDVLQPIWFHEGGLTNDTYWKRVSIELNEVVPGVAFTVSVYVVFSQTLL